MHIVRPPATCMPKDAPLQGNNTALTETVTIAKLMASDGKLFFIAYHGAQTIEPK